MEFNKNSKNLSMVIYYFFNVLKKIKFNAQQKYKK